MQCMGLVILVLFLRENHQMPTSCLKLVQQFSLVKTAIFSQRVYDFVSSFVESGKLWIYLWCKSRTLGKIEKLYEAWFYPVLQKCPNFFLLLAGFLVPSYYEHFEANRSRSFKD